MAEMLKNWLTERLEQSIKWDAEEFGQIMKDGEVIAKLLLSYHVIDEEKYYLIRGGNAPADIKSNWSYIVEWMREIEVFPSDSDINNCIEGQSSTLLRLFYKLFLHLDRLDRTNFIKREKKMVSSLVEKTQNRFAVNKIQEEVQSAVDCRAKPLLTEQHFIEWQKKKEEKVKETYDYMRYKYKKMIEKLEESKFLARYSATRIAKLKQDDKIAMENFAKKYPCKYETYSYDQLLELEKKATERKRSFVGTEWAKNYMENLHLKLHNKTDSEEFQKQLSNVISTTIWDQAIEEEETSHETELAKKVMKLSQFEKQMCTQILETKQQSRNLNRNRIAADKEYNEQREHQFNQYLDSIKDHINSEFAEIEFEKGRLQELHKKLYATKMKRKRQHYYEICYDTVLSLIDYATKYAHFQRLMGNEIPEHFIQEWKNLFYTQQSIFDILEPMEDLIKDDVMVDEEQVTEEVEINLNLLEKNRQDALNAEEFKLYHNYSGLWALDKLIPNYDPLSEENKIEYLGLRVLGHVIYTLLNIKYPYPPTKDPVDLPMFPVRALLHGLPDNAMTVAMQTLLSYRNVHVTRLEIAINYCLQTFKLELVGCTDVDLSYDKFIQIAAEDYKDFLRALKATEDLNDKSPLQQLGPTPLNCKNTQTPKTIPEEEIKLSTAADLGRYAFEALSFGDILTDHLMCAMLGEYLKAQKCINGFVIINYPNDYRQAQILEEVFSGREPPDESSILEDSDDIYLEENIIKHRKIIKDEFESVRISSLVKDPHKIIYNKPFESYFTCYIKLKPTDDILQEIVVWDLTPENSELIERFYSVLGLNYSMYYEYVDKSLLSQICWYIIGDFNIPIQNIDVLFGENVLFDLEFPTSSEVIKNKVIKPSTKSVKSFDKLLKRPSKNSMSSNVSPEMTIVPKSLSEELPTEEIETTEQTTEIPSIEEIGSKFLMGEEVKILAGDEDWDYGEVPIADGIGISMATYWEMAEKSYIHDIEDLFFAKRLIINSLVPYSRFIKDRMTQIITQPSMKQDLVKDFQDAYNGFENDWRYVTVAKNEWHCRVNELKLNLYHICDKRKQFAIQRMQSVIQDNWTMDEITTLVNTYLSCMQTELNRFFVSYQLMHDFYLTMIKSLPPSERLDSKEIAKINRFTEGESSGKKSTEDKVFKQLRLAYIDMQMKNICIGFHNNPFNNIIENTVKTVLKIISDTNDRYRSLISREFIDIAKIAPAVKKKEEPTVCDEEISPEEILKENLLRCIEEWTMGINGEMFRTNHRLFALQYKCYIDMNLFNSHMYNTYNFIQHEINTYHLNEIQSVDRLCKYIHIAIEDGRKIPETLILEQDTFIIDPNLLQYPTTPESDMEDMKDIVPNFTFTMSQLARLRTQFKLCAPNGIALQQAFIYLIQDFILYGKNSCEGPVFPDAWKRVDPEKVSKLVFFLYGDTAYLDWREFLIYCLNIPFPDINTLLDLRHSFRCMDNDSTETITRDQFLAQKLWFDEAFEGGGSKEQLRLNLIKNFLFELFETSANVMSYSAFLLAFCKNESPIVGFSNALAIAVGKKVCFISSECNEVINKLIEQKHYKDACLVCANECAQQFLDLLLETVMDICVGTTFTEIQYEATEEDTKGKSKKGKTKTPVSHSAREGTKGKGALSMMDSKMSKSASDIKTTFICDPCQETEQPEEVEHAPEEEEASKADSIKPDPNLVYSVKQSVIWNVLQIALPWHYVLVPETKATPYVERTSMVMQELENDTEDGSIYICKFVDHSYICKLLNSVKKFKAVNLIEFLPKIY